MAAKLVSIASVSQETGIGVDTLRAWERRYGRPRPERLPSGHRRYSAAEVRWLRRVAETLARGHRPSEVMDKSDRELDALLREPAEPGLEEAVNRLLGMVRRFQERRLVTALRRDSRSLGHQGFLSRRVVPLLDGVGEGWRSGVLEVRHEHFVSRIVEDSLRLLRQELERKAVAGKRPLVLLATLCGEQHGLGLHMASVLFARAGIRMCILGTDTPGEQIVGAAVETGARAVAISVSLATCGVESERRIARLREGLPGGVLLIAGGRGARRLRRGVRGVHYFPDLEDFGEWLDSGPFDRRGKR